MPEGRRLRPPRDPRLMPATRPTASIEATRAEISEEALHGHNLVAADGSIDESVLVLGIPAASTQPGSAIGVAPGVPSPLLAGTDIAAKQIMARVRAGLRDRAASSRRPGQRRGHRRRCRLPSAIRGTDTDVTNGSRPLSDRRSRHGPS